MIMVRMQGTHRNIAQQRCLHVKAIKRYKEYRKSLNQPPGAYLFFGLLHGAYSRGGLKNVLNN